MSGTTDDPEILKWAEDTMKEVQEWERLHGRPMTSKTYAEFRAEALARRDASKGEGK